MFFFQYNKKKLAKEIIQILNEFLDKPECHYKSETQEVRYKTTSDDNEHNIIFLGNIFNKVKHLKKNQRLETLRATLGAAVGDKRFLPQDFINSLMLRARTPFEINIRDLHFQQSADKFGDWVLYGNGEIILELTSDNTETVQITTSKDLKEHELSSDEAYKIAAAKLHRQTDNSQWEQIDEAIWISTYEDDYDFARLLVNPEFNRFPFEAAPVIYAPSHTICLITNNTTQKVLKKVIDIGNKLSEDHRHLSHYLWTFDNSFNCIPWKHQENNPGNLTSKLQILREKISQYKEQQSFLEKQEDLEYFVASFNGYQQDGDCHSSCVYSIDLPTSLPKADYVNIVDPEEQNQSDMVWGAIHWEIFQNIMGECLVIQNNLIPTRFHLLSKISEKQRQKLKQHAK